MKNVFAFGFIIMLTLQTSGQIYTDIKQLTDAGVSFPPQTLLGIGIGNCDLGLIKSAISKGADLNKPLQEDSYILPLVGAISGAATTLLPGDEGIIASQIRDYGSAVFSGRSVSDLRRDYVEIVRFFLQNGAKPNVSVNYSSGGIPLLKAAQYQDIEIVKLLLDFKADPNSRDDVGTTALHSLVLPIALGYPYKNGPEIARLLISKGAKMTKVSTEDGAGQTPLMLARSNLEIIQAADSPWRDYTWYNELFNSIKSLVDIYSKM
jgi:hypothetical protein